MKKKPVLFFCFILIFSLISCQNTNIVKDIKYFKIDQATDFGKNYMKELSLKDDNRICSYVLDKVSEGTDYVILTYKVVRKGIDNINADLDQFDIKVSKNNENYTVSQLNSKNLEQVYVDGENLRIRHEDTGMSDLLIRMKDLSCEVYPKTSGIMITKEKVNNEAYSMLSMDIKGKNVGIITKSNGKYMISLAQVEETAQTLGNTEQPSGGDSNASNGIDPNTLQDIMQKPIAAKLIPYDLITSSSIDKFVFSGDGNYILIQSSNNNVSRLSIYKNPTGEKINMNLDEMFPPDKYSLQISTVNNDGTFIKVLAIGDEKAKQGLYSFELKTDKISKVQG